MPSTRFTLILATTALAWLAYAAAAGEAGGAPSIGVDFGRIAAFTLTAVVLVRAAGLLVTELLLEQRWEISATSLVRLVIYLLFSGIAIVLLLRLAFDIDITTLLTTSALVSVILGLALQPTLAALFAGLAIQIEHQLRTGDIIRLGPNWAVVEAMRWRSVAARRLDGALAIVPNSQLVSQQIEIHRPNTPSIVEIKVPGPQGMPPLLVEEIIEDALLDVAGIDRNRPVSATIESWNARDRLAEFKVQFTVQARSLLDEDRYVTLLRTRLWYVYQRHGVTVFGPPRERREGDGDDAAHSSDTGRLREPLRRALLASRRWHDVDDDERHRVARAGVTLLYASQEGIRLPHGWDQATLLLVGGQIVWRGDAAPSGIVIEAPVVEHLPDVDSQDWDPEMLAEVRERLSAAIGPYAHRAVAMAAQEAPNNASLHYQLAQLIEYGTARDAFMHDTPPEQTREYGIGTVLVLNQVDRGAGTLLFARRQVELLALRHGHGF